MNSLLVWFGLVFTLFRKRNQTKQIGLVQFRSISIDQFI